MVTWQRTSLSTEPPMIQMADSDRRGIAVDAGETVTAVTAELIDLANPGTPVTGVIESATPNGTNDGAVVVVSGLTRGVTYELSTIFTADDGEIWTKTTIITCVA